MSFQTSSEHQTSRTQYIRAIDADIAASRCVVDTDSSHKSVARRVRTIVAGAGRVWIDEICALSGCKGTGVLSTCLPVRSRKGVGFVVAASNLNAMQGLGDHTGYQKSEGVDVVEELVVEYVQLRSGNGDTTEKGENDQEEGVEQGRDEDRRAQCGDGLTKSDREDFRDKHHGELISLPAGRLAGSPDGEIPAKRFVSAAEAEAPA